MTPALRPIERLNVTLGAGAVAGAAVLASPAFAASVALGAALEVVNFRALYRASLALFAGQVPTSGAWLLVFGLRFVLLAVAVGVALGSGAHPVGLVLGLSMIVPAALIAAWRARPAYQAQPLRGVPPPEDPSWDDYSVWRPAQSDPLDPQDPEDT